MIFNVIAEINDGQGNRPLTSIIFDDKSDAARLAEINVTPTAYTKRTAIKLTVAATVQAIRNAEAEIPVDAINSISEESVDAVRNFETAVAHLETALLHAEKGCAIVKNQNGTAQVKKAA